MPTYIVLGNCKQKGLDNIKQSPSRLDQARSEIEAMGGEIKSFYLTMGQYDWVAIAELSNDKAAATWALRNGQRGATSTETLVAIPEKVYRKLIEEL